LECEHDNVRAALTWGLERREAEIALRLSGALWRFWSMRGYLSEGRQWLDGALALGNTVSASKRIKALGGAGRFAFDQGALVVARSCFTEGLALAREVGDRRNTAWLLNDLSMIEDDNALVRSLCTESLAIGRELNDKYSIAPALGNLGWVALVEKDYAAAQVFFEESLVTAREAGNGESIATVLNNLGHLAFERGDYALAQARYTEPLVMVDPEATHRVLAEALEGVAAVAHARAQTERALCLMGAATAVRQSVGSLIPVDGERMVEQRLASARESLRMERGATAWAKGEAMSLEQAVAYALGGE
jgi:tetratricopeptide (TPR) repeat protein